MAKARLSVRACGGINHLEHIKFEILQISNHAAWRFTAQMCLRRLLLAGRPGMAASHFAKSRLRNAPARIIHAFFKLVSRLIGNKKIVPFADGGTDLHNYKISADMYGI